MSTGYYLQDNPNPNAGQFGWARNKVSGVVGVHTAESATCFSGPDRGDLSVAEFVARRTDFGSYHSVADTDSYRRWVHPGWAAWADTTNNAHAMSVSAALRANDWNSLSPAKRDAAVRNLAAAAADLVQTAVREGYLATPTPARRITAAEAISGSRAGFYGHGETNPGTRYDPGAAFPWDQFLRDYAAIIGGKVEAPAARKEYFVTANVGYIRTLPKKSAPPISAFPEGLANGAPLSIIGYVAGEDPFPTDGITDDAWLATGSNGIVTGYIWVNGAGNDLTGLPMLNSPIKTTPPVAKPAPAAGAVLYNRVITRPEGATVRLGPGTNHGVAPAYPDGIANGVVISVLGYVSGQDPYGTGDDAWFKTKSGYYIWANNAGNSLAGLPML